MSVLPRWPLPPLVLPRFIFRQGEDVFDDRDQRRFRMDFFYHRPPIRTQVSIDIVEDNGPDSPFFDRVNVGPEDLGRLFPGPSSDLAVTITPEPMHPAFPSTGLTCWVAPHNSEVRQEAQITKPLIHGLSPSCSTDVPSVFPPHHCRVSSSRRS